MVKITDKQLSKAMEDYKEALEFTERTHKKDLERINSLDGIVEDFDKFFYEYIYVILASGFKAKVAARFTPLLYEKKGDIDQMLTVFKNKAKVQAIHDVYAMKDKWPEMRKRFTDVDSLTELPRIGPTVKFHLARNIGVKSVSKPDKHMIRWINELVGKEDPEIVHQLTSEIAKKVNKKEGTVDFALWVWMSHNRGEEMECCHGGLELR